MEYSHSYEKNLNLSNAFKAGIALNIIFIAVELVYGFISNSMALIADSGHNFSDVLALGFSWAAITFAQRKPNMKFTYGFRRSTILVALLNTILLLVAVGILAWEVIRRLGNPVEVKAKNVIIVALIGIFINGITALLFARGQKQDLNVRSAFIHFVADTLVSLGVVIGGILILFTRRYWIDSVISFGVIGAILYSSYHLLIDSVNLALDAVPEGIDIKEVGELLQSKPEVIEIHDLHIWAMSTTEAALTVHLSTNIPTDVTFINSLQEQLREKFGIEHTTIQVEFGGRSDGCNNCN